jgi:hypothetical protein
LTSFLLFYSARIDKLCLLSLNFDDFWSLFKRLVIVSLLYTASSLVVRE